MASKHTADILGAMIDGKSSVKPKDGSRDKGAPARKSPPSKSEGVSRFEDTRYSTKDDDYVDADEDDDAERGAFADELSEALKNNDGAALYDAICGAIEHHGRKNKRMTFE